VLPFDDYSRLFATVKNRRKGMMAGSNQRTQLAAALLAFFLGGFGAHWYYLGEISKGNTYLCWFFLSLLTSPILIGWLGLILIGFFCLYDFITLLSMQPEAFNLTYNA
jgi:TM2 domain-containing membrane protein YozV